jgi:hypothetical protein
MVRIMSKTPETPKRLLVFRCAELLKGLHPETKIEFNCLWNLRLEHLSQLERTLDHLRIERGAMEAELNAMKEEPSRERRLQV